MARLATVTLLAVCGLLILAAAPLPSYAEEDASAVRRGSAPRRTPRVTCGPGRSAAARARAQLVPGLRRPAHALPPRSRAGARCQGQAAQGRSEGRQGRGGGAEGEALERRELVHGAQRAWGTRRAACGPAAAARQRSPRRWVPICRLDQDACKAIMQLLRTHQRAGCATFRPQAGCPPLIAAARLLPPLTRARSLHSLHTPRPSTTRPRSARRRRRARPRWRARRSMPRWACARGGQCLSCVLLPRAGTSACVIAPAHVA